ncbi:MAG: cupin domain-containing protein [Ignavibacteriaceae bacterium]|nr:cupin domain-containing protein [Ignavibacteriaceae bacterium]
MNKPSELNQEINVGRELRALCAQRGLSIRALAEKSGLAVNTLSLIQNGKTSPSVSTLQQLAVALEVPITAFFKNDFPKSRVAYIKAGEHSGAAIAHGTLEDLGGGLKDTSLEPFIVTMEPNSNSGTHPIVHTGHEFVFCLEGRIEYVIENQTYLLEPGDSLLFESHLPHSWQNVEEVPARTILVLGPLDYRDNSTQLHFSPDDL